MELTALSDVVTEDFLSCRICHEGLVAPKILRCLHTFCLSCLRSSSDALNPLAANFVCPTCRTATRIPSMGGFDDLLSNTLVERVHGLLLRDLGAGLRCDSCSFEREGPVAATSRCVHCKDYLCADCVRIHNKTRITRDHIIINVEKLQRVVKELGAAAVATAPAASAAAASAIAAQHTCSGGGSHRRQPISSFCVTCAEPVCTLCTAADGGGEHRSHRVCSLADAAQAQRQVMRAAIPELERRLPAIAEAARAVESERVAIAEEMRRVEGDIRRRASALAAAVRDREAMLLQQLADLAERNESAFARAAAELNGQEASFAAALQFAHRLLGHGTDAEIVATRRLCADRLRQLQAVATSAQVAAVRAHLATGTTDGEIGHAVGVTFGALSSTTQAARPKLVASHDLPFDPHAECVTGLAVNPLTRHTFVALAAASPAAAAAAEHPSRRGSGGGGRIVVLRGDSPKWYSFRTGSTCGLCLTREGSLVTVDRAERKVKLYTPHGQLVKEFRCLSAGGAAVSAEGHVIVAGQRALHVYRRSGELLSSLGATADGASPLPAASDGGSTAVSPSPAPTEACRQIAVNKNGECFVTDPRRGTVAYHDQEGHSRARYGGRGSDVDQMDQPEGVCCDRLGHVLVADRGNSRVIMLTSQCKLKCFMLTADDGLDSPRYVAINHDGHLVVVQDGGQLKVFKYL